MQFSKHILASLCVFVVASALVPVATAATLSRNERTLLGAVNDVRAAHNLRPLRVDTTLVRAFVTSFVSPEDFAAGALPGERQAIGAWMLSPAHRDNLLRPGWRRIGIGSRIGTFLGYDDATVITADFAG